MPKTQKSFREGDTFDASEPSRATQVSRGGLVTAFSSFLQADDSSPKSALTKFAYAKQENCFDIIGRARQYAFENGYC
jgi:hypothetical protein